MDRSALSFNELPYKIKQLISNKCLEKLAGPFSIIPNFIDFKNKLPKTPEQNSNKSTSTVEISKSSNLYRDYLHYVIYSRSADTKPGKGNNETIVFDKLTMSDKQNIASLTNIKNWRRMLDNNYENIDKEIPLFEKDGKLYSSVTEYLSKFFSVFEKTSRFLVFFQKIFDCSTSKTECSFSSKSNSLDNLLILWSTEFVGPSTLMPVKAPLCVRSLKVKWFSKVSG